MRIAGWALLGACSTAACGFPSYAFIAADDASQGDAQPPLDAGDDTQARDSFAEVDAADGVASDAFDAADAGDADDTSPPPDTTSPPDTTLPPDTSTTGFCASSIHYYCNDFDESTEPSFGFSADSVTTTGAVSIGSPAVSSTGSLRSTIGPTTEAFASASENRVLTAPAFDSVTRIEADVMVDAATYAGDAALLVKLQQTGGRGAGFGIDSMGLYLETIGSTSTLHRISKTVVAGVWFHVRLDVVLRTAGAANKVWVDGALVVDSSGDSTSTSEGPLRTLVVGLYAEPLITAYGARFDNVTVDFP